MKRTTRRLVWTLLAGILIAGHATVAVAADDPLARWIAALPQQADDCSPQRAADLAKSVAAADTWFADQTRMPEGISATDRVAAVAKLCKRQRELEQQLQRLMELARSEEFRKTDAGQRLRLQGYMETLAAATDLTARVRYTTVGTIVGAADDLLYDDRGAAEAAPAVDPRGADPRGRGRARPARPRAPAAPPAAPQIVSRGVALVPLCETLTSLKSEIGAEALAPLAVAVVKQAPAAAAPAAAPNRPARGAAGRNAGRGAPAPAQTAADEDEPRDPSSAERIAILQLIATAKPAGVLESLAEVIRSRLSSPLEVLLATEAICAIGVPQDAIPGEDANLPKPDITAAELWSALDKLPASALDAKRAESREKLLTSLAARKDRGIAEGEALLVGGEAVRPGDWLLMRNPSPYNMFSDLSPGLFSHVGVIAATTPKDGKRRIVVVDLPERGARLPATPVDTFVKRTLHYAVLRHDDPAVAAKMAAVGASIVGNPSQFDLNFRIDRVHDLKGKPLAGQKITTYCAGLLWLCGQETGRPREEFFPIPERGVGDNMPANLATLGISIGKEFVSPSGPLFSSQMKIVARRQPMYAPMREIEQVVFDHFALGLRTRKLNMSLDQFQTLRLKLAEAAKKNDVLAKALAEANNVSADMDLVSGAKAAAVVETLDEVAFGASARFDAALDAVLTDKEELAELPQADQKRVLAWRKPHERLAALWRAEQISMRDLRLALVSYYATEGKRLLDERFFHEE